MNNSLYKILKPFLEIGKSNNITNIKILLFKLNDKVFESLDFENDRIYQEPLLVSYFNDKKDLRTKIDQIIIGYDLSKEQTIEVKTDEFGRVYLPNIGWFNTLLKDENLIFSKDQMEFYFNSKKVDYTYEPIEFIKNTKIEILKYPIPLLKQCYFNVKGEVIDVEVENISKKQLINLTKAYNLIKINCPSQFELIEEHALKCVVFNTDTFQRNSFATNYAHGIGFYNAYQDDYDEVFFIDDIAHQTGHVIFGTVLFQTNNFFKIDKSTVLEKLTMPNGDLIEKRNLNIVFHALYTYYTSFICLDACLTNNVFNDKQRHEAMGRIAFYINKCYRDLLLIDNPLNSEIKAKEIFTESGFIIFKELKNKWYEIYNKWFEITKHFDMSNQPYNFTYADFLKLNPLSKLKV